jgi:hypothetical protein
VGIKLFVACCFLFYAYKISKKSKTTLNRCFITSFIAWGIYNILDSLIFVIAPISAGLLITANILWRFQMLMIFIYTFFFYSSAMIIQKGDRIMKNKKRIIVQIGLLAIPYIVTAFLSFVEVVTLAGDKILPENLPPPDDTFRVNEHFGLIGSILFVIPLIYFVIAARRLIVISQKVEIEELKRKIIANLIGNIMIPIGLLYFLARSFLFEPTLVTSIIGQFFFFISPFLIYYSQRSHHPQEETSKNPEQAES